VLVIVYIPLEFTVMVIVKRMNMYSQLEVI